MCPQSVKHYFAQGFNDLKVINLDRVSALQPRMKQQQHLRQEDNAVPKQRPQTLDSLFANMKERRMKAFSPPNNGGGVQLNGGGRGGRPRVPWARGRFGN